MFGKKRNWQKTKEPETGDRHRPRAGGARLRPARTAPLDLGRNALSPESIAALDQALSDLDRREPRLARIAECRIFSGLETAEIATIFGVTERTVQREWLRVKALLVLALGGNPDSY